MARNREVFNDVLGQEMQELFRRWHALDADPLRAICGYP